MTDSPTIPLPDPRSFTDAERAERAASFLAEMRLRRSVRDFDDRPVPAGVIEDAIRAAGTAPSGANRQPWHFAVVTDPATKRRIREAAEEEERAFYERRASAEWLDALAHLGTDAAKPFLETAPVLIVVFAERHGVRDDGTSARNYYVSESVGIATGMLIAALHLAGLGTLTHTPSPMGFLNPILDRPGNEKPYLLLVVGHPADGARVPDIERKPLEQIASFR
jgi:iodotyrosine deiodinase